MRGCHISWCDGAALGGSHFTSLNHRFLLGILTKVLQVQVFVLIISCLLSKFVEKLVAKNCKYFSLLSYFTFAFLLAAAAAAALLY